MITIRYSIILYSILWVILIDSFIFTNGFTVNCETAFYMINVKIYKNIQFPCNKLYAKYFQHLLFITVDNNYNNYTEEKYKGEVSYTDLDFTVVW